MLRGGRSEFRALRLLSVSSVTMRGTRDSESVDRAVLRSAETGEQRRERLADYVRGPSWVAHSIDIQMPRWLREEMTLCSPPGSPEHGPGTVWVSVRRGKVLVLQ